MFANAQEILKLNIYYYIMNILNPKFYEIILKFCNK